MKLWCLSIFVLMFNLIFGQGESVWMNANNGQWEEQVLFRVDLFGGKMYLEKDGFTYYFYENPRSHSDEHGEHEVDVKSI